MQTTDDRRTFVTQLYLIWLLILYGPESYDNLLENISLYVID